MLLRKLIIELLKLSLAGIFIGVFHSFDLVISILLSIVSFVIFLRKIAEQGKQKWVYISGMILSAIMGILVESWGIANDHWTYHDLSGNRTFPYWLPFAWILAFVFLYSVEKKIITIQKIKSFKTKLLIVFAVSLFLPAIGEVITIYLHVWTYHWPMKVLGVPIYALLGLPFFHMIVNTVLMFICKQYNISNPVFSLTNEQA